MGDSWNSGLLAGVGVDDGDDLVFVCIVANNGLGKYVKGLAQKNVIGQDAKNMHLQVDSNIANGERHIMCQAKQLVNAAIYQDHV